VIRRETYCEGRLVKEVDQIPVRRPLPGFRLRYVDGSSRWRLDGERVRAVEAEAFYTVWETSRRRPLHAAAHSRAAAMVLGGLIVWIITLLLAHFGWYGA
jgi:hypothetical protein